MLNRLMAAIMVVEFASDPAALLHGLLDLTPLALLLLVFMRKPALGSGRRCGSTMGEAARTEVRRSSDSSPSKRAPGAACGRPKMVPLENLPPLHSERHDRGRHLSGEDLARLVWKAIARSRGQGLMQMRLEGFSGSDERRYRSQIEDVDEYLLRRLKVSTIRASALERHDPPPAIFYDPDLLFDLVELLYLDCVWQPTFVSGELERLTVPNGFDQARGRAEFRKEVNSALALANPPLELLGIGQIVEADAEHGELYENPLPAATEKDITDPVVAAMRQFLSRNATEQDKRAAVKHLLDVIERIRRDISETMLKKDEAALFNLANNFALRHYDRGQKSEYDKDVWYDWAFHICLATIRAVLTVRDTQQRLGGDRGGHDRVSQ